MAKQIENQRSLHRAELELLQAQINPHFLYNTLDSIAILAESDRSEDVVTMVTSLSTFFRNSLNKGEDLLKVIDNGAGMDAEQVRILQAGIYEDKHTGLGLVNVHKRIRLYCDGSPTGSEPYGLSFESTVGKGSTVSVLLPIRRDKEGMDA